MQCAWAILSSVSCPALHYFSTSSHAWHDFRKTLLNIKYVFEFSLQLLSETFFILRITERVMTKNVYWSPRKVRAALVGFKWNLNFLDRFSKNTQISNFMKIRPVGDKLTRNSTFRNFAKVPKKCTHAETGKIKTNCCSFGYRLIQCYNEYSAWLLRNNLPKWYYRHFFTFSIFYS